MLSILLQTNLAGTVADTAQAVSQLPVTPVSEQTITIWELLLKGGPIMIPIGLLSLAGLYIFFERFFTIQKFSRMDYNFMNNIRDFVHNGNIDSARSLCKNTNNPIARMIEKGITRIGRPIREIEAAIENAGKLEVYKMEKNLGLLGTIAGIAPMFGFLGTISGVIKIFYNISLADNISIGLIAGGLYEKMITSAAGLMVGIFAYICYHYLILRIDRVVNKMEMNSVEFIDLLEEPTK